MLKVFPRRTPRELGAAFVNILNMAVALAIVALPKGNAPNHVKILELTL